MAHHFTQIADPETGLPILVKQMLDPIGRLYAADRVSGHQRAAADQYVADLEALDGRLRAASNGPTDTSWRGRRPGSPGQTRHRDRVQRAHSLLGPDRTRLVRSVLVDGIDLPKASQREFGLALDVVAVAYGLSTRTRH
jgi:hypothetical protein